MRCLSTLALLGAALGASTGAQAQGLSVGHLAALDADGNGTVSAQEYETFVVRAFQRMDKNGDGYLTQREAQAGGITPEMFAIVNTNGDGGISWEEFTAQARIDFATADRDGNGALQ